MKMFLFLLAFPFLALGNNLRMVYLHVREHMKGKK